MNIHLYEFILDYLFSTNNGNDMKWLDKKSGTFKVLNSRQIAKKWGKEKNKRKPMDWEKMSRAIRYYYKKGGLILHGGKRLEYRVNFENQKIQEYMAEKGYTKGEG